MHIAVKTFIIIVFSLSALLAQTRSTIQFYDSTGSSTASFSDRRFKKQVKPLDSVIEKIKRLQGVTYHWDTYSFPDRHFPEDEQIGLIAQEVEEVLPQVVHTDKDGYKSISYDQLTAVLIEATRKQQETIENLASAVRDLKKSDDYKSEVITRQERQIEELYFKVLGMENRMGK
jgi:hypothetical protein